MDEKYTFDDAGRLTLVEVEPTTGGPGISDQKTSYLYDAQGRRTKRIQPDTREERTTFDALGRVIKVERTSETTGCSGAACACGQGQIRCVALSQFYDNASRLTDVKGQLLFATPDTSGFASHYRGSDQLQTLQSNLVIDGLGRVLKSKDENDPLTTSDDVVNHRSFDSLGRLTGEGFSDDASGTKWTVLSEFDAASRRSTVTYPSFGSAAATKLSYGFDDLNRVRTIVDTHFDAPDETIATFAYVGSNRMVQSTRGDGTTWKGYIGSTTSWDAAGRRTQGAVINPSGQTLFEEVIRYTIRDEVRAVIWSHGRTSPAAEAQVYSFDELGRLMQFKQGAWDAAANSGQGDVNLATEPKATNLSTTWKLDELSNWRSLDNDLDGSSAVGPTVHGQSNFYEVFPTRFDTNADGSFDTLENLTMSRDAASGFIFKRDERVTGSTATQWLEYKHDLLGRLVEVKRYTSPTSFTVLAQYGYDSAGRLAWRCAGACVSDAPRKWLVYDGTQVVREGTGASSVAPDESYVWLGSTLIKATDSSGVESYLHQDRLGSVVLQTHNNGTAVVTDGRAVYDPYGRPSTIPTWNTTALPLTVPYGYAGARRDDAVGLYLMGARWYDPTLGRFIEQDPIGEAGGMNLYAYTSSSPVMWTDPTGLAAERARQQTVEQMANRAAMKTHGNRAEMIATLDRAGAEEWARQVARRQAHVDFMAGQASVNREMAQVHANIMAFIKSEQVAELARTRVGAATGAPEITGAGSGVGLEKSPTTSTPIASPQNSSAELTPVDVGIEWVTGSDPRDREFTDGDLFTEMLRTHEHVQETIQSAVIGLETTCHAPEGEVRAPYNLGGWAGVPKYVRDYSTVLTFGLTGNLGVTYLGSYALSYTVSQVDTDAGTATLKMHAFNPTTLASGLRPPGAGYTELWNNTVGQFLNGLVQSGPMSRQTQTFNWTEHVTFDTSRCKQ